VLPTSTPHLSTRRQVLRAGITAAIGSWAAVEVLGAARASAAPGPVATSARISMVGDSLTIGTLPFQADDFATAGWTHSSIDAFISRGIRSKMKADQHTGLTAVDAIRGNSGDTDAWIVALGTNDAAFYSHDKKADIIRLMTDHIGYGHKVMWVNVYLPDARPVQLAWNAALENVADERGGDMFVYDWASFAAQNPRWLALDGTHYTRDGYRYRSTAIGIASRDLLPADSESRLPPRWQPPRQKTLG
jgi:lysophospholipase L1-like esterase